MNFHADRSKTMYLMYEDLARAHQAERLGEAQELRRGHELALAARLARKAERATRRAERAAHGVRLALARAV